MALQMLPEDETYETWLESLELAEYVGEATDLAEFIPYVKSFVGAVSWFRRYRARAFLKSLKHTADEFSDDKREKFEKVLRSKEGAEILAEYAETAIRTASITAIAALALLYADTENEMYSPEFKLSSALAFQGLTDSHIDAFLALSKADNFISEENLPNMPYPVVVASDNLVASLDDYPDHMVTAETRVSLINDLISRGLLLPDYASARLGDGGVGVTFGVGESTEKYRQLLLKAKTLLPLLEE